MNKGPKQIQVTTELPAGSEETALGMNFEKGTVEAFATKFTAKRDFVIRQNEFYLEIKKGDDLSGVPKTFLENLKTEKVI